MRPSLRRRWKMVEIRRSPIASAAVMFLAMFAMWYVAPAAECGKEEKKGQDKCGVDELSFCKACGIDVGKCADLKPQSKCPIMGEEIDKSLYVDTDCCRIYVCCKGCIEKVKADPKAAIKKIIEAGEKPECLPSCPMKSAAAAKGKGSASGIKIIGTEELAKLLASDKSVVLLDARTGKWDDGRRIPGAKSLSPEATAEEAAKLIPSKDATVIAYCAGPKCPAGKKLAEKLISLGYTDVRDYHDGIQGWVDAGKEVVKVEKK